MAITNDDDKFRVSLESLRKYTPLYQDGLKAKEVLDEKYSYESKGEYIFTKSETTSANVNNVDTDDIDQVLEVSSLEARWYQGKFALDKLLEQATPLLHSEIAKIAAKAQFHDPEEIHPVLFYEARTGLEKGFAKYDYTKNQGSVTNYLFQWATTYAKRELNKIESPFGVPPSRYEKYKKISAVRSKLTEQLGRYAANNEVHDYFTSGNADIKTYNGPVELSGKGSAANKNMDLKLIADQEYFEKNLAYTQYLNDDTSDFYPENIAGNSQEFAGQEKSLFKEFVELHDFSPEAIAVILTESQNEIPEEIASIAHSDMIPEEQHRSIMKEWRALIREKDGIFHNFIKEKVEKDEISDYEFDLKRLLDILDNTQSPKTKKKYKTLFVDNGKKVKKS